MKPRAMACVLASALVGACAADRLTAPPPAPVAARVADGEGREAPPPLFVVDGRMVAAVGRGTRIDLGRILDVKVLGSKQAAQAYGARGANGAVLVATRAAEAGVGGPAAGCWLGHGCNDVTLPPPPPTRRPAPISLAPTHRMSLVSMSTLSPRSSPLFVIDGRVCDLGECGAVSTGDITEVQVWTGPPATAIYGSNGANGVLIITTRHAGARR